MSEEKIELPDKNHIKMYQYEPDSEAMIDVELDVQKMFSFERHCFILTRSQAIRMIEILQDFIKKSENGLWSTEDIL